MPSCQRISSPVAWSGARLRLLASVLLSIALLVVVPARAGNASPAHGHGDRFHADPANSAQVRTLMDTFTATGLAPSTRYRFTVRSVDAAGHESPDSAAVVQSTTVVPRVFDVTDYGAAGDGTTVNTAAIQRAIDACTPGGKVRIPAGVFKAGAVWLHSDMTLEVAAGATLPGLRWPRPPRWAARRAMPPGPTSSPCAGSRMSTMEGSRR